jgi:hypothetical protein
MAPPPPLWLGNWSHVLLGAGRVVCIRRPGDLAPLQLSCSELRLAQGNSFTGRSDTGRLESDVLEEFPPTPPKCFSHLQFWKMEIWSLMLGCWGSEWWWMDVDSVELNILTMFLQLLLANLIGLLRESKRFYVLNMVYKCMFIANQLLTTGFHWVNSTPRNWASYWKWVIFLMEPWVIQFFQLMYCFCPSPVSLVRRQR